MPRLRILESTVKTLFARSGNECAFAGCTRVLVQSDGRIIADVAHIEAAEPAGPRYNPNQDDEERRSYENLVVFCPSHHRETDNVEKYPVADLKEMKRSHEERMADRTPPEISQEVAEQLTALFGEEWDSSAPMSLVKGYLAMRASETRIEEAEALLLLRRALNRCHLAYSDYGHAPHDRGTFHRWGQAVVYLGFALGAVEPTLGLISGAPELEATAAEAVGRLRRYTQGEHGAAMAEHPDTMAELIQETVDPRKTFDWRSFQFGAGWDAPDADRFAPAAAALDALLKLRFTDDERAAARNRLEARPEPEWTRFHGFTGGEPYD